MPRQTVLHLHLHVVLRHVDDAKERLSVPWQGGVPGDVDAIRELGGRLAAAVSRDPGSR